MKALKVLVLLVSISAASVLVWNAARNKKPAERDGKDAISAAEMQSSSKSMIIDQVFLNVESEDTLDANILAPSSKSAGIIGPDDISEIVESDEAEFKVTEEEVSRTRDMMMSTSKSGRIMSDDKIREMLEERKKAKKLMPSSKVSSAILRSEDVKKIMEGDEPKNLPEPHLIPSSKNPNRLIEPKDVERIVEDGKSELVKPQDLELPPLAPEK